MPYIDSHCHLDFAEFSADLSAILGAANRLGVMEFVVPSVSADNFATVLRLSKQNPTIHHAFGLHPCFMSAPCASSITTLEQYSVKHLPCAIGEIGLDFFIEKDPLARERQLVLFEAQIQLAQRLNLPVLLHVRKAHDQVLAVLKKVKFSSGGIVHAFNGSMQQAQRYTEEFDFKLGFGGAITHTRATKLRALVTELPLTDLVLETDAPDMPLANMSQAFNQPENIWHIAQVVFELRTESAAVIEKQLEVNTRNCLSLA